MSYLSVRPSYPATNNLWCKIFGHKISGYGEGLPYGRPVWRSSQKDGTGTVHVTVYGRCDRCQWEIPFCKIHDRSDRGPAA